MNLDDLQKLILADPLGIPELISEHGSIMEGYFTLRLIAGDLDRIPLDSQDLDQEYLESLDISEFIRLEDNEIVIKENGRYLYVKDRPVKPKKKYKGDFVPVKLDNLASIVGQPQDWHNKPKYMGMFNRAEKKHSYDKLMKMAYWMRDAAPDYELGALFSDGLMRFYEKRDKENKFRDRVAMEGYTLDDLKF